MGNPKLCNFEFFIPELCIYNLGMGNLENNMFGSA